MRPGQCVGVLCMLAGPVMGAPIMYPMTIDEAQSSISLQITVNYDLFGSPVVFDGNDASAVGGSLDAAIDWGLGEIQISDVEANLGDGLNLVVYNGDLTVGVTLDSDPGELGLYMVSPGDAAPVDGGGNFEQTGNTLGLDGVVTLGTISRGPTSMA